MFGGYLERRVWEMQSALRGRCFVGSEPRAVDPRRSGLRRCTIAYDCPKDHERRLASFGLGRSERIIDFGVGMPTGFQNVPPHGPELRSSIFGERQVSAAINCDLVSVIKDVQLAKAQMPCERGRFLTDALHKTAISNKDPRSMVADISPEVVA